MTDTRRLTVPDTPGGAAYAHAALEAALLKACDLGVDAEAIERVLLEHATHPHGLGFAEAHLLVWDDAAGCFHGWGWARCHEPQTLEEALDPSRPPRHDPERQERVARLRRRHFDLDGLDTVLREAWSSGRVASGPADRDAGLWAEGVALLAVALRRGNAPHGLLVVAGDLPGAVDGFVPVLDRAAAAASSALSIERRARSDRRRAQRANALREMARACVSAMNVAEALHLAARLASRVAGARGSAVWRVQGEALRLEVTHGPAGQRERLARELGEAAGGVVSSLAPRLIESCATPAAESCAGIETAALVPVVAYGRALGALAVWERITLHPSESRGFEADDVEFLHTLADMLAMVLDQAGRFDALRAAEQEREELRARVRREERLAAAGEAASRAAREVRNPIASVAAFARRAHREMRADDPLREYLEVVMQEVDRIDRITREQLALSEPGMPRLRLENLNAVVGRVLQRSGQSLVRRRIRLLKRLAADLPELLLDPQRMERVVGNIVAQAVDAAPLGGRVRIETRRIGAFVVLEAAHDGAQDPGALMEELFAPFAPSREAGGVGLGVARQIIREHGGEVRVRSDIEWRTVLTLTLPVHDNSDRRRPDADRRRPRRDRRQAADPA